MVKCLLWLEFEIKKLDVVGEKLGLSFFMSFAVNADVNDGVKDGVSRVDLIEIYETKSFDIPILLAVGKWESNRWLLSSRHDNGYLLDKVDQTFEECFTLYGWIE
jgi:hypothetical protein